MDEEMWQRFSPEAQQVYAHTHLNNNTYTTFAETEWNYATRVRMHLNVEDVAGNKKDIMSDGNLKTKISKNGKIVLLGDDDNEVEIANVEELEHIVPKLIQIYDELPTNTSIEKLVKEQMEKILERSGIL